jgi:glyoxylase-like metal-dependent hydrolase (beta-lactamase superfamily II)
MIFEQIATGGCQSYLVGCPDACVGVLIDPELRQIDRYLASTTREGLRIRYLIDTHTHADHFSATRELGAKLDVPVVMHALSPAPFAALRVNDGDMLAVGNLRLQFMHTPGHTRDSTCIHVGDRLFTGDTLLIGGTGRTDLPTGDPNALYDSLFNGILKLDPALLVFPAHDYKNQGSSTLAREIAENPRLQKRDRASFVEMMMQLNLAAPTHLTEALRTNMTGGRTVAQLLAERIGKADAPLLVLDVREKDAFDVAHVPGAKHLPRGQLELRINDLLPDPTARIVTVCEFGKISTLAAATLRDLGFTRAAALDGGMKAWRDGGFPVEPVAAQPSR